MKPILFDENATTFTSNGLGALFDAISCTVSEERNGEYELEMEYPMNGQHYEDIAVSRIICAQPAPKKSNQPFRIYKITKKLNGRITVYARHISYQLSYIPTMPFTVTADSTACATVLSTLKSNAAESCPFTFNTDVTTVAAYSQLVPASIRSRLGGVEGSVLDQYGGEYEWDGYTVNLWRSRGTDTDIELRYGKNLTDLTQEKYISNTITGLCPYWASTDGLTIVTLPEKVIESAYATNYPFKRTVVVDLSSEYETAPSLATMRSYCTAYLNKSGIGVPTVSITVDFVDLKKTTDYEEFEALQDIYLCDTVSVFFEKLGIETTAKVVSCEYDVLGEKYNSVTIGSVKTSLAQTIQDTNGAIETSLAKSNMAVKNATAWLTGSNGYVMAVKNSDGTWKELLFLDTNDASTATNVLRINENGIGFSSNGVNGPYTQAWTLDGKLVVGGTNVPSFTVYDANDNIIFQTSRSGTIWNSTNSSMNASGTLSASGAILTNATITGGSLYQENSGRYLNLVNGNIHGGFSGSSENIVYLAYRVDGNNCITLHSPGGICLAAPRVYVRDGTGGSIYAGYTGSVVTSVSMNSVSVSTSEIVDFYGNSHTVVTGVSGGGGTWSTKNALNGIIHN